MIFDDFMAEPIDTWCSDKWLNEFKEAKLLQDLTAQKKKLRNLRSFVFKSNQFILEQGYYYTNGTLVDVSQRHGYGRIYKQPFNVNHILPLNGRTYFKVINKDSIDAGKDLFDAGYYPAVLNMACEDGPGGGVIGGCYGQEESLFRRTDLYVHMYPFCPHAKDYGLITKFPQYPLDHDTDGVYVSNAIVLRASEQLGYKLLQQPYNMSFIAVPALRCPDVDTNFMLLPNDITKTKNKIRTILRLGLDNGHDALVLGAWGCGIFNNPPAHIASLFKEVFYENEFLNKYKIVYFAILEDTISLNRRGKEGNIKPFKNVFEER